MLLQPNNPTIFHHKSHLNGNFTSLTSNSPSFSSGFLQDSVFFPKQPIIISTCYVSRKNPVFSTRSWVAEPSKQGESSSEKEPSLTWIGTYKKISMLEDRTLSSASVLNELVNKGKKFNRWELCRVAKELRRFRRYRHALQVYEWMNGQAERYRMTTSETAIQLDLIAKVHGSSRAEQYFQKLPNTLRDKKTHGALLNAYVRAKKREEAESLMDKMRKQGYANHSLPFNVMMTLYMKLKENDRIELLVGEMESKYIPLDTYSYNIWLSSCESPEKLEKVYVHMEAMDMKPNWDTFCTMASLYVKFGELAKSEMYLRKIEGEMTRPRHLQCQYLISLYGSIGKKEDIYRIWNLYKATFDKISNMAYHSMISALVKTDDIEGAEKIYNDWLSVKSVYDARVGNILLNLYVTKGLSEKAKTFFDQMIAAGGKPNAMTWGILAEDFIRCGNVPEALSYLDKAASVEGPNIWKPKPAIVSSILEIIERDGDVASKDVLFEVLRKVGCLDDAGYMSAAHISNGVSHIPVVGEEDRVEIDGVNDGDFVLYDQLQGIF